MNLFFLDNDLDKCAEYHVDKHIVKMPLEAAQLLCTLCGLTMFWVFAHTNLIRKKVKELLKAKAEVKDLPIPERPIPYLPTMENHPCTFGLGRLWTTSNGYIAMPMPLMTSIITVMVNNTSQ